MTTQLATSIKPTAPLQAELPQAASLLCPVRDLCHNLPAEYRCGFEQAGSVMACHKRRRLER